MIRINVALNITRGPIRSDGEERHPDEDTMVRLAGGDLGDRAKQPSALSRTLSRALNYCHFLSALCLY